MSGLAAGVVTALIVAACLLLLALGLCRAAGRGSRAEAMRDVGPDALRLLEELDAHLDTYLINNPDMADGFARLRQVIRDEQANTPEGE